MRTLSGEVRWSSIFESNPFHWGENAIFSFKFYWLNRWRTNAYSSRGGSHLKKSCPCRAVRPVLVPQKSPVQKEHFEMVRAAIMHEDNLVNHRLTWLLAAHAFLLTFFTYTQQTVLTTKNDHFTLWAELFLCTIFAGATWMSLIVGRAVLCANLHIDHLKEWWMNKYSSEKLKERELDYLALAEAPQRKIPATSYPPICGSFIKDRAFHLSWIPYILAMLDSILVISSIFILCQPPAKKMVLVDIMKKIHNVFF
jgi:hypothetical protein